MNKGEEGKDRERMREKEGERVRMRYYEGELRRMQVELVHNLILALHYQVPV